MATETTTGHVDRGTLDAPAEVAACLPLPPACLLLPAACLLLPAACSLPP
jgi:hypothetical protein